MAGLCGHGAVESQEVLCEAVLFLLVFGGARGGAAVLMMVVVMVLSV